MAEIDLSGTWRATLADPERRRRFSDLGLDDATNPDWHDLAVPGHWRSNPTFAHADGPVLYRRRFDVDSAAATRAGGARWWLVLEGLFYQGDVWLDGHYVGDTEGYFFPHQFEVTDQLASGTQHLLAVEVTCSPQADLTHKRNLTGSLQHSSWLDPAYNPGGIWRPVRIESTGPLRIRHTRVRCLRADEHQAVLALRAVVDAVAPTSATLRTVIAPSSGRDTVAGATPSNRARDHELHHVLAAGENRIEWTVTVDQPRLWWPHSLGDQPTYDIEISVFDQGEPGEVGDRRVGPVEPGTDQPSDLRRIRTGLRTVRLDRWQLHVNGERLFLKGTNLVPTRQALAEASSAEVAADITAAKELGLDLVRVHSHIARPELYTAADETGMLIWQDLPLQWGYARSVRKQALRQAREAVDLLSHHPSLVIWCTHSEPVTAGLDPGDPDATQLGDAPAPNRRESLHRRVGDALPTWNRSLLGPSIRRTLRTTDGTRPVVTGSGMLPRLPGLDATATHLWYGWEYGALDDLALAAVRWPNLVRFVAAFGAASVPPSAEFAEPQRWPDLDWEHLRTRHGLRRDLLDRIADPHDFETFDAWREATQAHQARLLRTQIETLRRLKYQPTGGFATFFLSDAHPAISHSILDHERTPKLAYDAVKQACRPVIVTASATARRADRVTVDVHVVSDLRQPLDDLVVELGWGDDEPLHRWAGAVAADGCTHVASVDLAPVPGTDAAPRLTLRDSTGTVIATNTYSPPELLTVSDE